MPDFAYFIPVPDSSLLYTGHYDPVLVTLSVAVAIFASYAAILVSQHVAASDVAATRRKWLLVGGLCLGLGIWAMHFVGMLAFNLPCATGYDSTMTLLSMLPSILACTLALHITSRRSISRMQLATGGLLFGGGIGAMHYAGMAAMQLEGLIRYDFRLFLLSIVVAVVLATFAIWIKFRLHLRGNNRRASLASAATLGLAVSGMHYTAMAAAYFLREGDNSIVDSQIGATFLATSVLVATSVITVVTIVATYVDRPNLLSLAVSYRVIGLLLIGWFGISWLSSDYYYASRTSGMFSREFGNVDKELGSLTRLLQLQLQQLQTLPQVYAERAEIRTALRAFGADARPSSQTYEVRKRIWTQDRQLARFNDELQSVVTHLEVDAIWVLNAAGDCVVSSNHHEPDSFVGTNYSAREYFQQVRNGRPGRQYAVGLISKLPGLYYAYPVFERGRFLGAVVVKRNVSNFSRWLDPAQAFMTDTNGVIILAADRNLQLRTLPDAAVLQFSPAQLRLQYGRDRLEPLAISSWDGKPASSFAVRVQDGESPGILVVSRMADDLIKVHLVARPLAGVAQLHSEQHWLFALLAVAGSMLIIAASAMVLYWRESRKGEADLRIAATAFETQEGLMITDAEGDILRVNRAFSAVTGYTEQEVQGQTPRVLRSGRHDATFYRAMWDEVREKGVWQGEIWNRRKDGTDYPTWQTITAVKDKSGRITHYVGMHTDITQRKAAEEEIAYLAFYDLLTQLPNRRLLIDRLQQALVASTRSRQHGALLFIDLDNFKILNDTLGHEIGDLLLKEVARRLVTCVREGDTVARLGGDEFVIMLEGLSAGAEEAAAQAKIVGEKILAKLNRPYELAGYVQHSTPSIGITLFADHLETVDELLKRADLAMYQAKGAGRNTLRFFDPQMQAAINALAELEADLREAIAASQFLLYYQPQVNADGVPTGAEALLRWQHPRKGLVAPSVFIPLAEDTGLIIAVGQWVLETACEQLQRWAQQPATSQLTLAVNVSQRQFHHPEFVSQVQDALARTGANAQRLKLELTESLLIEDVEDTIAKMEKLKAMGIGFSLDDFGTGYSSLTYLKRLPLDQLKIDQSFVRDVFSDTNDAAIVRTIIALGQSLGLEVLAEGVETQGQHNFLLSQGCTAFQGYLFGKPVPIQSLRVSTTGA